MAVGAARSEEGFTSAGATRVMLVACRAVGLDGGGAELIRLGENALFRLVSVPVIMRIARSVEYLVAARKEVAVSRWLADEGFPAARVVEDLEQPLVVDGHPVTFWHLIVEEGRPATYGELGGVLRDLHALVLPDGLELPRYSAFGLSDLRLERAAGISEDDLEFLRKRGQELKGRLAELRFGSPLGPVHGDAHTDNLMVDRSGVVHLIDLENFCVDHPEWDLEVAAHEYHRLGWVSEQQYADFVRSYDRDLTEWPGFATLCAIQEFKMTTWLMQNVSEGEDVAQEVGRRIASLRDDAAPRNWLPY
ncbi:MULTISPECIES: aminoglycoside phosphotransferase family protein [unclassified Streptomyces]|uniref:phosphotransferase enzyme family protein n=1 Tax=unclassified Streptomyces TaxID=2593676 RepID=UPI001165AC93|nr:MULTISPECIES: aminoglycoside phosphotransferase family protein [unclassified Streptomyces]QDN87733.1 aminoglycoside phosphotransferase family protein [Streptomyces sp. RLB3-6]QDO08554.1 aminoglycoside phosphotransferase family protein [Streptomyces sp. S1D4-23]